MTNNHPLHPVDEYAYQVLTGEILACKWVRLACRRHEQDIKAHGRNPDRGLWFDERAASQAIDFFSRFLVFYEGEFDGRPFQLELWQKFVIGSIFGWKRGDRRRFRTAYVEIAKGNGKSPLAAGIGLFGLVADNEPGAEIYAAATMREQAGILFRDAKAFVEGSASLRKKLNVGVANIDYADKNSYFRPVSSEHRGLDGKRPHIALIDEIHEHPNGMVVDKMRAGTKGRRQALIFEITNAGYDRQTICYQHHEYSEKILEGVLDNDAWFGYMTGLDVCAKCAEEGKTIPQDGCPDCDDWTDPATWIKANPNLGISIQQSYLQEQVDEAREMLGKQNIVKRLNFCIWTESLTKWIAYDKWEACAFPVDPQALAGRKCYCGLDLSETEDLTAFVLVFPPEDEEGRYEVLCRFFIPEDNLTERALKHKVPYQIWRLQGHITVTPGNFIDDAFIIDQIRRDSEIYDIQEVAYDAWGSSKIVADLERIGFYTEEGHGRLLIKFRQGDVSMNPAMVDLYKLVLSQRLAHGGNPILSWHVSNTVVKPGPTGLIKPDKQKSTEKIDGMVALAMGVGRAMLRKNIVSIYETQGIRVFA